MPARAELRIYLGFAPGVGKTAAMLAEGISRREAGSDVVIALVEDHGRPAVRARAELLEQLPRREVEYRGSTFAEMDLDAVLGRAPQVALVDELAHHNVPGSGRNEKRWQDVLELLEAGIEVISTCNIAHLESLGDAAEQITGARMAERVPDWLVRSAAEVRLVDCSPEQLRQRIATGAVFAPELVPGALAGIYRLDRLLALRELAARFVADESEEELLEHLAATRSQGPGAGAARVEARYETTERIVVALRPGVGTATLLRRAARMAARSKAQLFAVHVAGPRDRRGEDAVELEEIRHLAADLGARYVELRGEHPAEVLMAFATGHEVTQIVIGSSSRSRLAELLGGGSTARALQRMAGAAGIDVHTIARRAPDAALERSELYEQG